MPFALHFDLDAVLRQVDHATNAKTHRVPYGETDQQPALFFVKDSGCYLMSSGTDTDRPAGNWPGAGRTTGNVVYAEHLAPEDEDSWQLAADICGGDDFAERIILDEALRAVLDSARTPPVNARWLIIELSETSLDIGYSLRPDAPHPWGADR